MARDILRAIYILLLFLWKMKKNQMDPIANRYLILWHRVF